MKCLTKTERWIIYPLLALLFLAFTFTDLPLMEGLYNEASPYGQIVSMTAEAPFQFLAVFGGVLVFRFRPKDLLWKNLLFGAIGAVLAIFLAAYGGGLIYTYFGQFGYDLGLWVAFAVAFLYLGAAILLAYLIKTDHPKGALAFGIYVLAMYAAIWLAMVILKMIWYRPRYRFLVGAENTSGITFRPWYVLSFGFWNDDYSSFPSGHVMNALGLITLTGISFFLNVSPRFSLTVRIVSYGWAAMTGLARIIVGAHFATDVTAGFFVAFLLFDLTSTFLLPWLNRKTKFAE
jgi:membrane-associated phospholipid phosphatase